jgi:DNA-directed RNA polymerase sigma subunit (sigma70/sigma32)
MQAAKRFDPAKGVRFATYAVWWIKAAIQEYILRSWSLVRIGTTTNQRSCSSICARRSSAFRRSRTAISVPIRSGRSRAASVSPSRTSSR